MQKTEGRKIPLTQGKFAIVDEADYDELSAHRWHLHQCGSGLYAARCAGGRLILMHRQILNAPAGMLCDHKNHDGLDNRRSNLRLCTPAQNQHNSRPQINCRSAYKGVSWNRQAKKWQARIGRNGQTIFIGYYDYEQDAAIAYDDMAAELFGEFACLNCSYFRPEIQRWLEETRLFETQRESPQVEMLV